MEAQTKPCCPVSLAAVFMFFRSCGGDKRCTRADLVADGVDVDLLGTLDELGDDDRVVLRHVRGRLEEALRYPLVSILG